MMSPTNYKPLNSVYQGISATYQRMAEDPVGTLKKGVAIVTLATILAATTIGAAGCPPGPAKKLPDNSPRRTGN